jgi:hypothetical protein
MLNALFFLFVTIALAGDPCDSQGDLFHRVFVYDLPAQFVAQKPCAALEVRLRQLLRNAAQCVTKDARSASLFYVPFDVTCLHQELRAHTTPENADARLNALSVDLFGWLRNRPYFGLFPEKHVFPFLSSKGPLLVANWRLHLARSILLVPLEFSVVQPHFDRRMHIVVPQLLVDAEALSAECRKFALDDKDARPTLAYFAGSVTNTLRGALIHEAVRLNESAVLRTYVDAIFQSHNLLFRRQLTRSQFCLLLRGDVDSTLSGIEKNVHQRTAARWSHVEEFVLAQCRPAVVCDRCELPFSELIDWNAFAVRLDESDVKRPDIVRIRLQNATRAGAQAVQTAQTLLSWPDKWNVRQFTLQPSALTALLTLLATKTKAQQV